MKLQIDKNILLDAINITLKAVPVKTTSSILKCLLIDASTEQIQISATDNELGIKTVAKGMIEEHGMIAVNADIFSNIVRKLPDGRIFLSTDKESLMICCEKIKISILGFDGMEFPSLPEVKREHEVVLSQFSLKELITKTLFSISSSESNVMMTGELFEVNGQILRAVSLDGHRISIRNVELKKNYDNQKVIIPGKSLSELSKILSSNMDREVNLYFSQNHALFSFDDTVVVTRLIEGTYFNIDRMVAIDSKTKIRIDRNEFLSCLERSALLVREEEGKPLILDIKDEEMGIHIRSAMGNMDENISIEKEGEDLTIGFNPKFLLDALRAIEEEEVDIYFESPRSPASIKDNQNYCYLILPINFISV